ncbi:lysis protein [Chitiniphilus purpureus]|uniref:Lysis protein n=1 Tax=Chitiniphilus purpureus TaxID=2981137 RepID=A0ABY6DM43_9NEIS|nr:lysis protein [Chitiniphilus sp. CD1]UXY14753.1 lysis protein [Chitiniphilus sp. CD1]
MIPDISAPQRYALLIAISALIGAAVAGSAAWTIQGWRYGARIDRIEGGHAKAAAAAADQALAYQAQLIQQRDAAAARAVQAEAKARATLRESVNENKRLAAAVAAGNVRLRIAATCPSATGPVSAAGESEPLGDGAGAELAASARSDYFALRDGITEQQQKLNACQGALREFGHAP